jgi:hypothetical protein
MHSALNRDFNLDLNPDLNLELNRALFAQFYPQLFETLFGSLFGAFHANKYRRFKDLMYRELYRQMLPPRQPVGRPLHGI